jgi:hypothetical protein
VDSLTEALLLAHSSPRSDTLNTRSASTLKPSARSSRKNVRQSVPKILHEDYSASDANYSGKVTVPDSLLMIRPAFLSRNA